MAVVVAVDGSAGSWSAIRLAAQEARLAPRTADCRHGLPSRSRRRYAGRQAAQRAAPAGRGSG